MKVAFFSSTGSMVGGAVMCLKEILLHCMAQGTECFVILESHGNFEDFLKTHGIRYAVVRCYDWLRPLSKHGGLKNDIRWAVKAVMNGIAEQQAYHILKKEKPDVYHLNVLYNPCGAKSAHKLGIPVVWHLREFAEINADTPFFHNSKQAYRLIARSERIVCVSDCLLEYYKQFLPEEKMIRVYDGIKMPNQPVQERKAGDKFRITLSGGAKVKGHTDIIEAIRMLKDKGYDNLLLQIAGKFTDEKYLEQLEALVREYSLEEQVVFLGFMDDMDKVWADTDIAVVCSRFESFGLSAVEAMARAVPLVCAKSTGSYEITNKGEYCNIYEVSHSQELADKLQEIITQYNRYSLHAAEVAEYIRRQYCVEAACAGLVSVFLECCR